MKYLINTSDTNITFTVNGKVKTVPKNRVWVHYNTDTVTFLLIERYDTEGICLLTTKAEDLEINGTTYTYQQLLDGEGINDLFSPMGLTYEVVEELPQTGEEGVIYLVPNEDDTYTEYIWISDEERFEIIGTTGEIDLRNYYTKSEVDALIPTNVSDLNNDAGYITQTAADSTYATQVVVNQEVAARIQADSDINTTLGTKADKSDTYTKSQVDALIPVVPTNVSAFTNDAGYLTEHQSLANYYTKSETDAAIQTAVGQIDLSDYQTKADADVKEEVISTALNELEENKQDKLTAGQNITIQNNVISSTGGEQQQADWNQTDSTAVDFIKNKPDTSEFVTKAEYNPKELAIAEALTDLNENKADASDVYTKTQTDAAIQTAVGQIDLSDYQTKADADIKEEVISTALNNLAANKVNNLGGVANIVKISAADYAALTTKDNNTLYIITSNV